MLQVRENEISLRNSSGGPEYLRTSEGTFLTMQCKWTFTKRLIFSTLKENAPCCGNNHKKNASLAAIVRYINITTIYTAGYLEIFNAGHFYSRKHSHDLWRKKHWITMVFNETTNYNVILLSKQGRTQLIYSTKLITGGNNWTCFWKFRGKLPGCSSPDCGISLQDLSASLYSGSQTFMSCGALQRTLNTCGPLLIDKNT